MVFFLSKEKHVLGFIHDLHIHDPAMTGLSEHGVAFRGGFADFRCPASRGPGDLPVQRGGAGQFHVVWISYNMK